MSNVVQRNGVRVVAFNKSGSASIINTFSCSVDKEPERSERSLDVLRGTWDKAINFPDPIITIAYFRHPLLRVASVYNYFFTLARDEQATVHFMEDLFPTQEVTTKIAKTPFRENLIKLGFNQDMSFEAFCDHLITSHVDLTADLHLKRQSESFVECRGKSTDTWIARLDEIETAWPQMVRTWGMDCTTKIAHLNKKNYSWITMYQDIPVIAKLLLQLYHDDYRIWELRRCSLL